MAALRLWRWNPVTGLWTSARTIEREEDAARWLEVFQRDEPGVPFRVSRTRPKPPARGTKPSLGFGKVDVTRNFRRERKRSPSSCAAGSYRARKTKNGALLTFCCPKGKFNKRTGTCRVGMVVQSIGRPRRRRR